MRKINCLIIEDEPLGAEILEGYIEQIPFLQLITTCSDAISAMSVLQQQEIDLIFLDIHLPKIKGFDFLKTLNNPPSVIITSAYMQYALQSYEHNVIDYLLKPIEFSRFLKAVNKLNLNPSFTNFDTKDEENTYAFFNVNKKKIKINFHEILYIEGQREYIKVFTSDKSITTKFQIGQVNELLNGNEFLRIHRSYIVATKKVEAFNSSEVEICGKKIPIGRSYKEIVKTYLNSIEK